MGGISDAKEILAERVAELVAKGFSVAEIAECIGKSKAQVYRLLDKYPEVIRQVQQNRRKRANLELEKNLDALTKVRDEAKNDLAKVRAVQGIEAMAGIRYERDREGVQVIVLGETVNINALTGEQMEKLAAAMGERLGPEVEKILDGEFKIQRPLGSGREGEAGGTPAEPPGDPQAP